MAEQLQGYYESAAPDPSNVTSLYAEMVRSRDYGDHRFYPDYNQLRTLGDEWTMELANPLRSERAKKDIDTLLGRITFELVMRQNERINTELPDDFFAA